MSSNNDAVTTPMIERNPNGLPGMDTSDLNTLTGEAVLSFHNISYRETVQSGFLCRKRTHVTERLSNINGIMKPGLNAIMGPQDGSRTLLLNVLAGRKDPRGLSGDILINGEPRPANFKCTSGYVPQKDVVMRTVTVRENVEFSAALRLPMSMPRDEKRRRINEVLELLHLDGKSNVKPRTKELRKRTSIAMELVTEHPILFLDDPTTGLDMIAAIDVISVLRRVSMGAPPSSDWESYNCDYHNNPADFFLDIITGGFSAILDTEEDDHEFNKYKELSEGQRQVTKNLTNMYAQSSLYSRVRTELDILLEEQNSGRSSALEEITCATPFWHQLWWIICSSFKNFLGFSWVIVIQVIITVIMAIFVGKTFHFLQNDCYEAQIRHEHASGYYRMSSYFFAKLLAELVSRRLLTRIIFTVTVLSIAGNITDVKVFFRMLFTIMMLAYSASYLRYIGAGENATAVPRILLAFYFVSILLSLFLEIYSVTLQPGLSLLKYISILHYGYTALLHNEFLGQNFCPEDKRAEISSCQNYVICTGEEFLMIQGIDLSPWGFWQNHVALSCIMIILLSITYMQLLPQKKVGILKSGWRKFQQLFK
ncbi:ATP-binding cassette sub-family G member 3-like [Mesocricetus auratus]|uniref:ATP-binding cassette sub-family G member 3-like n=1 Tax=Mesocricetus auratus TaxID=10036 RepID=A0A1U7QPF4_MESAU|nr:ATP-binding cassette sub-family G member 3-like [Mesocricetus auratus]